MKQMTRQWLGACAAIALMSGAAFAQNAPATDAPSTPPAMGAPDAPGTPMPNMTPPATGDQPAMPDAGTGGMATDTAPATPATPPAATAETVPPATDSTTMPSTTTAATEATGEPVSGEDMIGRTVVGSDGEALGSVSDVIVDSGSGKIQQFIIASGGFLGLGAKDVAVDFDDVTIEPEGGLRATSLTQADIEGLPEFDVSAETKSLDERMPEPAAGPAAPLGGMAAPGAAPSPAPAAQ